MNNTRAARARINIIVSFVCQIFSLICGFIIPRLYISTYGSEAYGATSSITQFLAYITLLEGGVAGVARAALYRPLAEKNYEVIGEILGEIKNFFKKIGFFFAGYVILLACTFKYISNVQVLDWFSTFLLVLAISISTFAQYFIGITYSVFLQANQQQYISNVISITAMVMNTAAIVILVNTGFSIVGVKLISSCIFIFRPVLMWLYVKKRYPLNIRLNKNKKHLTQKWTAFGHHIAYFLHSNTDIAVLSIFGNLKLVAVYSVYYMITSAIQNLTYSSITPGMEAVFGDMIAKEERSALQDSFGKFETLLSTITNTLLGTTAVMIVPFVRLYTAGVNDANYIVPLFSLLLVFASYLFCLRLPYHSAVVAAGRFKDTRTAAYGEAAINIATSIILVIHYGIVGVAIGTISAVTFRFFYYAFYLKNHVLNRSFWIFIKRLLVNMLVLSVILFAGNTLLSRFVMDSYFSWALAACCAALLAGLIAGGINFVFYNKDMKAIIKRIIR